MLGTKIKLRGVSGDEKLRVSFPASGRLPGGLPTTLMDPLVVLVAKAPEVGCTGSAFEGRGWGTATRGPAMVSSVLRHLLLQVEVVELRAGGDTSFPQFSPLSPSTLQASHPVPLSDLFFLTL